MSNDLKQVELQVICLRHVPEDRMIRPLLSSLDLPQGDLRVLGSIRKHGAETVVGHKV